MNKIYISWDQVFNELKNIDLSLQVIYGVPTGGMILTAFLQNAAVTHNPEKATIILDDLCDSGKTKEYYDELYPNKTFITLFDKSEFDDGWLIFPWEVQHPGKMEFTIQDNIIRQLQYIGENPKREGLIDTPNRIVKMYKEIFGGYNQKAEDILTTFSADGYDEIVLLKDIEIYSICEHHMVPFFGRAHVAYLPDQKVVGISKLARLVDLYAKRLQIQERIGDQVTTDIMNLLNAKGAACVIEATHMCMRMRGVEKQNSIMTTSSLKGVFRENTAARQELMGLIK